MKVNKEILFYVNAKKKKTKQKQFFFNKKKWETHLKISNSAQPCLSANCLNLVYISIESQLYDNLHLKNTLGIQYIISTVRS